MQRPQHVSPCRFNAIVAAIAAPAAAKIAAAASGRVRARRPSSHRAGRHGCRLLGGADTLPWVWAAHTFPWVRAAGTFPMVWIVHTFLCGPLTALTVAAAAAAPFTRAAVVRVPSADSGCASGKSARKVRIGVSPGTGVCAGASAAVGDAACVALSCSRSLATSATRSGCAAAVAAAARVGNVGSVGSVGGPWLQPCGGGHARVAMHVRPCESGHASTL
eukprot:363257-Chlamydomonas_euryale.AAC.9